MNLVAAILAVVIASPDLTKVSLFRPPYLAVFEIGLLLAYVGYQQFLVHRLGRDLGERKELFRLITEHAADMIAVVDVICIDDFGTGHSSLERLRRFPVDILKIDRSFVAHMDADPSARAIVQLIIDLAHNVNLKLIAEGIETAEQVSQLRNARCEFGQGYFFSKAVDADAVDRLLAANDREITAGPNPTQAKTRAAGSP